MKARRILIGLGVLGIASCIPSRNCIGSLKAKQPKSIAVARTLLMDTLSDWKERRLISFAFADIVPAALSDTIFPDCDGTHVFFPFSIIDPDTAAAFDELQVIGADRTSGTWRFYVSGYPSYSFDRSLLPEKRSWSRNEMTKAVFNDITRSGYVDSNCAIDCNFFARNNFFLKDQEDAHSYFLQDTVSLSDTLR